jgi:tRNA threonylcarbamoyl adenosine modification protein YjeE
MTPRMVYQRHLESEKQTQGLAEELSLFLRPGMMLILKGELGAGKSTFARALIRALADPKSSFDIPSPSFALVQTYEITRIPVAHVDLYRTTSEAEILELGLADLAANHLLIIEWPNPVVENLGNAKLVVEFSGTGNARDIEITGDGVCNAVLARLPHHGAMSVSSLVNPRPFLWTCRANQTGHQSRMASLTAPLRIWPKD